MVFALLLTGLCVQVFLYYLLRWHLIEVEISQLSQKKPHRSLSISTPNHAEDLQ